MNELTNELLEAYVDGELTPARRAEIDAIVAGDADSRRRLDNLLRQQQLCRDALAGYTPTTAEAAVLARRAIEHCYEMELAPVARIDANDDYAALRWIKRAAMVAACLLIGTVCFLAGRGSISTPAAPVRYAVEIQTPSGETVSQTFSSYEQAQRFYRNYQLSKQGQAVKTGNARETMAMASQGIF